MLAARSRAGKAVSVEGAGARRLLIGLCVALVGVFLVLPLGVVFWHAFSEGLSAYGQAVFDRATFHAVKLTLFTTAIAVPLNTLFGVAAAWAIAKFEFRGRSLLVTLIDLPFSTSPVVAGLCFVLLFGANGFFGAFVNRTYAVSLGFTSLEVSTRVIFALPGIVLATVFITFPFVARELIPLMQAQGTEEEQVARVLGANGWQIFWRVTLPNIRWGLLYGVILCTARAMGEFGAVYVVSAGSSDQVTLPLHVERVYYANMVRVVPAFAVASLLAGVSVITLGVKAAVEWRFKGELKKTDRG
ncbi:sulfate ABC transporter permease subunit CysW [Sorangium sp. So ce726]|uniref:sulfate ABC transporter permease subunit CysW n=1 Tax=Sorangium sp. So ce726 TaxID=3133319 RepID=UPI003F5F022C